ncbi:hypothetical protein [Thermoleptolyngbya sp.]
MKKSGVILWIYRRVGASADRGLAQSALREALCNINGAIARGLD